jgi:hypothetical protein
MSVVRIVFRLCRNRLRLRDPRLAHRAGPGELAIFFLNLLPPYNLLCWAWIRLCLIWGARLPLLGRISRPLVGRGFLYGALRHLSPEDRSAFAAEVLRRGSDLIPPAQPDSALRELSTRGYARLGRVAGGPDVASVVRYFQGRNGYLAQTPLQSDGVLRRFDPGLFPRHPGS